LAAAAIILLAGWVLKPDRPAKTEVSDLANSPAEAVSAYWAARKTGDGEKVLKYGYPTSLAQEDVNLFKWGVKDSVGNMSMDLEVRPGPVYYDGAHRATVTYTLVSSTAQGQVTTKAQTMFDGKSWKVLEAWPVEEVDKVTSVAWHRIAKEMEANRIRSLMPITQEGLETNIQASFDRSKDQLVRMCDEGRIATACIDAGDAFFFKTKDVYRVPTPPTFTDFARGGDALSNRL
jgi:hypothetical protein